MKCEDIKEKISAFIDNEIDAKEVAPLLSHLESCYQCRQEYLELLALQKEMKHLDIPLPGKEWYEEFQQKMPRKITGIVGRLFFFASYMGLLIFSLVQFFNDPGEDLFLKILIGGITAGVVVLLGVTIADRIHESKNDRYKGVMK